MATSPHPDGTVRLTLVTLSVKPKPNRTLKTLLASWLTLARGKYPYINDNNRVDVKLTQTNDVGLMLNAINTIEISK